MDLTDDQKSIIKTKLAKFQEIQEGTASYLEQKHNEGEKLGIDDVFQTLLDQNYQLKILKDVIVSLHGIEDLDSERDTYLSKFYR